MKETRHPHRHLDPRQPKNNTEPGTNPPLLAWKGDAGQQGFSLRVSINPDLKAPCLAVDDLSDPLFLPDTAFEPGTYYWQWDNGQDQSEIFNFKITAAATHFEVPPPAVWLERLPQAHPRLFVDKTTHAPAAVNEKLKPELLRQAEALKAEEHIIAEPPFLQDKTQDHQAFFEVWYPTMWNSRRFVKGAETLALAHLVSGDTSYAQAACQRLASISRWDPDGSTHVEHNDEAHMSVIWHGAIACDWVWDHFTEDERQRVIAQFRRRGENTFAHIHDTGIYGITRFDSHAGREIVFLALIALVFHEHIPQAQTWLEWLRPVLCGMWPIWAEDDGAWDAGPSYGLAYVQIMTLFATGLKGATGIDLYQRPFWNNHADWRRRIVPHYAEWIGFGDHSQRWASGWRNAADLVDLIGRETGSRQYAAYVEALRSETDFQREPGARSMPGFNSQLFLCPQPPTDTAPAPKNDSVLRAFTDAGWAAFRTHLDDAERDLAFIFRSSPYGSISHAHANNNDFVIHVGGRVMAMPSGYYGGARLGYGGDHHAHWVWHTKSHNCVTLSDAPQIMRSPASTGKLQGAYEDKHLAYVCGNADASYIDRAQNCRRHVFFLKRHSCWVLIDQFVAQPGIVSALQWNIHSWEQFTVDEGQRSFSLKRGDSHLHGHFVYHDNAFFSLSQGWDPEPLSGPAEDPWKMQYHLRFTPTGLVEQRNLGVVLCPQHTHLPAAAVHTERGDGGDLARIGDDAILVGQGLVGQGLVGQGLVGQGLVGQGETMRLGDHEAAGIALLNVGGQRYVLDGEGLVF
jgi:hypothetical protein